MLNCKTIKGYISVPNNEPEFAVPYDKNALTVEQLDSVLRYDPEEGKIWWKIKTAKKVMVGFEAGCVKATRPASNGTQTQYRYIRVFGKSMPAPRVAWALHYGEFPVGKIQFEDGNPLNIKISNLRMSNSLMTPQNHKTEEGRADYMRESRAAFPMEWKDSFLRSKFDITLAEFGAMLVAQGGVCATCGKPETQTRNGKLKALSVDHDHATGKVRGLLCGHCNTALGKVYDNRETLLNMIRYLDKHSGRESAVALSIVPAEDQK